jgi:hypothetical protein
MNYETRLSIKVKVELSSLSALAKLIPLSDKMAHRTKMRIVFSIPIAMPMRALELYGEPYYKIITSHLKKVFCPGLCVNPP